MKESHLLYNTTGPYRVGQDIWFSHGDEIHFGKITAIYSDQAVKDLHLLGPLKVEELDFTLNDYNYGSDGIGGAQWSVRLDWVLTETEAALLRAVQGRGMPPKFRIDDPVFFVIDYVEGVSRYMKATVTGFHEDGRVEMRGPVHEFPRFSRYPDEVVTPAEHALLTALSPEL